MREIAEAQTLLAALAETEEVKTAEEQRQRRLHLQTAYGQAMMWAKGFAAEEARDAFPRASELAARTMTFRALRRVNRWLAASTGGELRSARELALTLLARSGGRGTDQEAGVANIRLGLVAYLAWRFPLRREPIASERSRLATSTPTRKLRERFRRPRAVLMPRRDCGNWARSNARVN